MGARRFQSFRHVGNRMAAERELHLERNEPDARQEEKLAVDRRPPLICGCATPLASHQHGRILARHECFRQCGRGSAFGHRPGWQNHQIRPRAPFDV